MLNQINEMQLPTYDQMNEMSLEQLKEWCDKLYPFYCNRKQVLEELGFEAWKKSTMWLSFYMMVDNIQKGLPRWERVANYHEENRH